jgi:hypothetical protein
MSWQYDKEPIDYLRQRVKYYRKRISKIKNWIHNKILIEKYGEEQLRYMMARGLLSNASYLDMFKKAVKDLETIEEIENRDNQEPIKQ